MCAKKVSGQRAVDVAARAAVVVQAKRQLARPHVRPRTALAQERLRKQHAQGLVVNPIRCARAWIALQAVVAQAVAVAMVAATAVAAIVVALAAVVVQAVVLEATQMATRSADRATQAEAASAQGATPAVALIAGATGLVGKELLSLLLADNACREVHSLVRKPPQMKHAKLRSHVVDFATLTQRPPTLPQIDEVYICLGTTIKVAGSKEAFKAVDFDAFVAVAGIGLARGATKLGVISAMGASSNSPIFYNRIKGEMEEAVSKLGYESVTIARPSFLAGDRESLQQANRPGESIALAAMRLFNPIIPANYRSVEAIDVASTLLRSVRQGKSGTQMLLSAQLQR